MLSSVVWGSQLQAVKSAVGVAEKPKKWMENHPLVSERQKLMPSVTHVFRNDQKLLGYLEYDGPAAAATVSFFRDGRKVFESAPVQATASGP